MAQKTFTQVREISIRVSVRCNAFVHLIQVHIGPCQIFVRERAQHDPGRMAAADSQAESATSGDGCPSISRNSRGSLPRHRIGIVQNLKLHGWSQQAC